MNGLDARLPLPNSSPLLGDPAALRAQAEQAGFLFFRALLPREALDPLRAAALSACRLHGFLADGAEDGEARARQGIRLGAYDDPRWFAFLADLLPQPEFAAAGSHGSIRTVVRALLPGGFVEGRGDLCRLVSPDACDLATPPHQDRSYISGSAPLWTAWLPVGDCPRALGPLAILPRSHRAGLLPHAGEGAGRQGVAIPPDAAFATADLSAGDALFFSGLTVHAALPNLSPDRLRVSVDYRFEAASA